MVLGGLGRPSLTGPCLPVKLERAAHHPEHLGSRVHDVLFLVRAGEGDDQALWRKGVSSVPTWSLPWTIIRSARSSRSLSSKQSEPSICKLLSASVLSSSTTSVPAVIATAAPACGGLLPQLAAPGQRPRVLGPIVVAGGLGGIVRVRCSWHASSSFWSWRSHRKRQRPYRSPRSDLPSPFRGRRSWCRGPAQR